MFDNKRDEILTNEKLQDIYKDEKFRNQVANAHGRCNSSGQLLAKITCSYPITWIVTDEQIEIAKKEKSRAKAEVIKNIGNKLVFVGMGMTYTKNELNDDIGNYRIRTEFTNRQGNKFFVEFGHKCVLGKYTEFLYCDHAIDRTKQDKLNNSIYRQGEFYNYKNLERKDCHYKYTKQGILDFINHYFDCNFSVVEIDNYNLRTDDFVCISPE